MDLIKEFLKSAVFQFTIALLIMIAIMIIPAIIFAYMNLGWLAALWIILSLIFIVAFCIWHCNKRWY